VDVLQAIEKDSAHVREQIENRGFVWQELITANYEDGTEISMFVYYSAR